MEVRLDDDRDRGSDCLKGMGMNFQRMKAAARTGHLCLAMYGLFAALLITQSARGDTVSSPSVTYPELLAHIDPKYPPQAIKERHQGTVMMLILVDVHGNPKDIRVEKSSGFSELDLAALEAVRQWKYKPEIKYGIPVEGYVRVPVNFNLHMLPDNDLPIAIGALSKEFIRIELPEGYEFTASLETGDLVPSRRAPFKPVPGQHTFPSLPSNPSGYAQTLETAYHDAYVAAMAQGEPPASRCLVNCMRTLWMKFHDGAISFLNVQEDGSQAIFFTVDGLPTTDDARALATMSAYLHQHPGLELMDWELREKAGPAVQSARLFYYDLPSDRAWALARMAIAPPPPPPPPSPPESDGPFPPQEVCRRTLVRGAEHTVANSAAQIPMVTVVIDRNGEVEHEWVVHSSGSKWTDSSALTDASHWTFNGHACDGQRVTESVGIARQ